MDEHTRTAVFETLELLSMTRCPYYAHGQKCDRGCHQEPACTVDEPIEGWVGAAIKRLEEALHKCESCDGRGVVDENGNPGSWETTDAHECAFCDGTGSVATRDSQETT